MVGCLKAVVSAFMFFLFLVIMAIIFFGDDNTSSSSTVAENNYEDNKLFYAYVTANKLNVRKGPSKTAPIIGTLKFGDVVQALKKEGDWIKVRTSNGTGYISAKYAKNMGSIYHVDKGAVSPMTRRGYPKTYSALGASRFREANILLPSAAKIASENSQCNKVSYVGLSNSNSTKGNLWFFVDCNNGARIWVSEKDIKSGGGGKSATDLAPDETSVRMWCMDQIKRRVNYPETLEIHDFAGYATSVSPTGNRVVYLDFTAKNGFGVPIRKTAVCTVTPNGKASISFRNASP